MLDTVASLAREGTDIIDLKVADTALAEMAEAFRVFQPLRRRMKVTIFGSARTEPDHPAYRQARALAAAMAGRRLDGGDRGRPGHHGRRHGGRRSGPVRGRQHPAAPRAGGQPLHRPGPQAGRDALLLHPQAHAVEGVRRLHRAARRIRHPRRGLRAADAAADGQGGAGAGGPARRAGRDLLGGLEPVPGRGGRAPRTRVVRRPGLLHHHRRRVGGHRRAARLLPQLPLVPLGGRPTGAADGHPPRTRPSWPISTGASPTSSPRASSARSTRSRPNGPTAT